MKTMKKLLALVMALAMVLAMAVTVSAEQATLKITNAQDTATYTFYKIFSWELNAETNQYWYKATDEWDDFLRTAKYEGTTPYYTLDENNFLIDVCENSSAASTKFAADAKAANITEGGKAITSGGTIDYGIYLMVSSVGSKASLLTVNSANVTVREKNTPSELPTLTKTFADAVDTQYQIGDTVNFKIVIEAEEGIGQYVIHDKMVGADLNTSSIAVKIEDSTTVSNGSAATDWASGGITQTVVTNPGDGCNFHITLDIDPATIAYQEIEITYSAVVNEDYVNGIENKAWIDGEMEEPTVPDVEKEKRTITLTKQDNNGTMIGGAKFELYAADGVTQIPVAAVKDARGNVLYYRPAATGEEAVDIIAGNVQIMGLDKDVDYVLLETEAPAGYTINGTGKATINANGSDAIVVKNSPVTPLPDTGGIGTTIFYTVGGLMVVAALVLLVTKKRMSVK